MELAFNGPCTVALKVSMVNGASFLDREQNLIGHFLLQRNSGGWAGMGSIRLGAICMLRLAGDIRSVGGLCYSYESLEQSGLEYSFSKAEKQRGGEDRVEQADLSRGGNRSFRIPTVSQRGALFPPLDHSSN